MSIVQQWDKNQFEVKVRMCQARMNTQRGKRSPEVKQQRKQVSEMMQKGQNDSARIKVEGVIRDQHILQAYDILELYFELINSRSALISQTKEIPRDLIEAIASTIFAAKRLPEISELGEVASLFASKYGKEFAREASADAPTCLKWSVNENLVRCLLVEPPQGEEKLQALSEIAQDYKVENWDAAGAAHHLLGDGLPNGALVPPAGPELSNGHMGPPPYSNGNLGPPPTNANSGPVPPSICIYPSKVIRQPSAEPALTTFSSGPAPPQTPALVPSSAAPDEADLPPADEPLLSSVYALPAVEEYDDPKAAAEAAAATFTQAQALADRAVALAKQRGGYEPTNNLPPPHGWMTLYIPCDTSQARSSPAPEQSTPAEPQGSAELPMPPQTTPMPSQPTPQPTIKKAAPSGYVVRSKEELKNLYKAYGQPDSPAFGADTMPSTQPAPSISGPAPHQRQPPPTDSAVARNPHIFPRPMPPPEEPHQRQPPPTESAVARNPHIFPRPMPPPEMPHQRQPPPTISAVARNPHIFPRPPMPPPEMPHQRQPPPTDSAVARNPHIFPRPMPPPEMPHQRQPPPTDSAVARNPHIFPRPPPPPPEMPHQRQPPPTDSAVARNPHVFVERSNPPPAATSPFVAASVPASSPPAPLNKTTSTKDKDKKKDPCKVQ